MDETFEQNSEAEGLKATQSVQACLSESFIILVCT